MLHSFGSNSRGQLSLGHETDVHTPTRCIAPTALSLAAPDQIVAGGNHTLVLSAVTSDLFACGDNTHLQCLPHTPAPLHTLRRVPLPAGCSTWTLVAAGWNFSILVADATRVFACGHGAKGELGLGTHTTAACQRIPGFPPDTTRVRRLHSGVAHTVAVLSDGRVFGWGAGRKGQLGEPAAAVVAAPRRVCVDWPVEWAVCAREFTVLVERVLDAGVRRRVCVLGADRYGVRGALGGWLDAGVRDVQAGWSAVYVLYEDGGLRGFGRNDRGQLPPVGLGLVERFAAGSEHGVAVAGGRLVAWGWGEHGNCGRGSEEPGGGDVVGVVAEVELELEAPGEIRAVGAGCATSWVWAG